MILILGTQTIFKLMTDKKTTANHLTLKAE